MTNTYDAIVIGGDHNRLVAAAYLARAARDYRRRVGNHAGGRISGANWRKAARAIKISAWAELMRAKKRIVKTVLVVLLAGIMIQILFDPLSSFLQLGESLQARIGLPAARKKWESQGITHYTFDIQGSVPLVCMFGGNIEVQDGVIIHTSVRSDGQLSPALTAIKDPPLCNYQIYTIPLLFDELERSLHESPLSVSQISFNQKYGFITSLGFENCGGRGLLSPVVSDCHAGFSIENFQVLDE